MGTIQKVKVIKKQTFLVILSFFQGISYNKELKLGFITVQSEQTNIITIAGSACLMRAILKDPKWQQTPDVLRFKMNQQYRIIVIINIIIIALLWEAACQSHTFNITEYNRHKRQTDFKYALFLNHFIMGILQVESTGWWHDPWATVWGCFLM